MLLRARRTIGSGATSHICYDKKMITKLDQVAPFDINAGDGPSVRGAAPGEVEVALVCCVRET